MRSALKRHRASAALALSLLAEMLLSALAGSLQP